MRVLARVRLQERTSNEPTITHKVVLYLNEGKKLKEKKNREELDKWTQRTE